MRQAYCFVIELGNMVDFVANVTDNDSHYIGVQLI